MASSAGLNHVCQCAYNNLVWKHISHHISNFVSNWLSIDSTDLYMSVARLVFSCPTLSYLNEWCILRSTPPFWAPNWHHPDRRDTKQLCHDSWLPVTLFCMLWSHVPGRLPIIPTFMGNDHDVCLHDTPARYYVTMSHRDPSNSCSTTVPLMV